METNWASEHLQIIRTLMERSALYRRALAPIMLVSGSIGLAAAVVPRFLEIKSNRGFSLFWLAVGTLALAASVALVRRQALKEAEPFWSLPMRRVTQALFPGFLIGLTAGIDHLLRPEPSTAWLLAIAWIIAYGCALHAAGFFMARGIKLFGWILVLSGSALLGLSSLWPALRSTEAAHYLMGTFFGLLHVAYGIYLCFTERQRPTNV